MKFTRHISLYSWKPFLLCFWNFLLVGLSFSFSNIKVCWSLVGIVWRYFCPPQVSTVSCPPCLENPDITTTWRRGRCAVEDLTVTPGHPVSPSVLLGPGRQQPRCCWRRGSFLTLKITIYWQKSTIAKLFVFKSLSCGEESKPEVHAHEFYAAMHIKTHLNHAL